MHVYLTKDLLNIDEQHELLVISIIIAPLSMQTIDTVFFLPRKKSLLFESKTLTMPSANKVLSRKSSKAESDITLNFKKGTYKTLVKDPTLPLPL